MTTLQPSVPSARVPSGAPPAAVAVPVPSRERRRTLSVARRSLLRPGVLQPTLLMALADLALASGGLVLLAELSLALPDQLALVVPVLWLATLAGTQCYEGLRVPLGLRETSVRVVRAAAWFTVLCVGSAAALGVQPPPGPILLVTAVLAGGSLAPRLGMELVSRRQQGLANRTRVVIAGHHPREVSHVVAELRRHEEHSFEVVMVCLARNPRKWMYDVPVAVGLDRLGARVRDVGADALVVLPCRHVDGEAVRRLGWQLEGSDAALFVGTSLLDTAPRRTTMAHVGGLGLLRVRPSRHRGPARALKGVVERIAALVLLVVAAPLLLGVACAVRWDSPGPATYRQTRVGRAGRPFTMYKFRTMCATADQQLPDLYAQNMTDGVLFKIREDPRITRLGAFLRRYSLDELPQLVNVALGHMSLVGPRPALPEELEQYEPDAHRRLAVKPGLTGLWQVSGRSDLSWSDAVRLDLRYVDNWSPGLDLLILCRTVRAVLDHRGAY